jgi:hypothetical protein
VKRRLAGSCEMGASLGPSQLRVGSSLELAREAEKRSRYSCVDS